MQKVITICDYCGRELDNIYTLLPVRRSGEDGTYKLKPDYEPYDMCLDCIRANLIMIKPGPAQRKKTAAGADPEEEGAALKQQEPEEEPQIQESVEEGAALEQQDAAEKQQAEKTVKATSKRKVDHGRIVALYTAKPPRSIEWIADDCKCSQQTVINHLKKEGLYKTLQEQKEEKQEEEE